MIPFNKPYISGRETEYIADAVKRGKISGNGDYTKMCQNFFEERYGFPKTLLTTSCTDALEMCALLLDIAPGDEVILPSYTFVSTANAFALRGAKLVFADSRADQPNIDETEIEELITPKTKAIVIVHYAGVTCDMDAFRDICDRHDLVLIEDAAQAIDSYYLDVPLGSLGDLATFSFHETKNIISGEGGMLVINNELYKRKAEIVWEKGTNRAEFFRGEVDKYGWQDLGSSFLPSEITAAFLWAQLENIEDIQMRRLSLWEQYNDGLSAFPNRKFSRPIIPEYATKNGHLYYILCQDIETRTELIQYLKAHGIHAVFHYLSLHSSPYYADKHDGRVLPNSDRYTETLLRLPLYYELESVEKIVNAIRTFDEK